MHPTFWKTVVGLLTVCVLYLQFGRDQWSHVVHTSQHADSRARKQPHQAPTHSADLQPWSYQWERDHNNHALSSEQCDSAFPQLYHEVDRAAAYWSTRNITSETVELYDGNEAGIRILIKDQQIRVLQTKGMYRSDFRLRILAVLHQSNRAVRGAEAVDTPFDDMDFTMIVDDWPNLPTDRELTAWSFTRESGNANHDQVWLMPDFNFWSSPPSAGSFQDMQAKARRHDAPISEKLPQAVWRGVLWTNAEIREALINATQGQPWADVESVEWNDNSNVMALEDFCQYAYLINTEGRSWSSRLTHILNCDSVPILHDLTWSAHYYHLLEAGVNYIPVHRNFSDMAEKVQQYIEDPQAAQEIADTARQTFREGYTTPAATACYWRRLLRGWSSVAFRPTDNDEDSTSTGMYRDGGRRGVSFEEFV